MQKSNSHWQWPFKIFGIISLYLSLIAGAIKLTIMNRPLYIWVLKTMDIPKQVGMSLGNILKNYDILLDYLRDSSVAKLQMPDFPSSESGAFHFWEVRNLFILNDRALIVFGIMTVMFLYWVYKNQCWTWLAQVSRKLLFLPIVVVGLLALFFDQLFVLFHEIAFDNDAWIFSPATDPIIQVLPQEYFMACFISVFVLVEIGTAMIYWLSRRRASGKNE